MLRYKEKEDIEARFVEVDEAVEQWRERIQGVPSELREEFLARLQISLIYHDAALEGEVLTHSEIKAAIDPTIISDSSLIPAYETIKHFNQAYEFAVEFAAGKKRPVKLDTIREICGILNPEEKANGCPYRKDNPLHRLYYHEIAPPEKITYRMRKFGEWLEESTTQALHPVERAAKTHFRLMSIFPWAKRSGRTARIVANLLLVQADYPIAIIHSIDRQRYYEALRTDNAEIVSVYLEAVETTALSEIQVYEEASRGPRRRRRA